MLPEAAGRGQHFQDRGHSFSRYGPTQSIKANLIIKKKHNVAAKERFVCVVWSSAHGTTLRELI